MTHEANDRVERACELFLEEWQRGDWMIEHGDWASSEWNDMREEYEEACGEVEEAYGLIENAGERVDVIYTRAVIAQLRGAIDRLEAAADALDGQKLPNDSDYIQEGTLDPDNVEGSCVSLGVGYSRQGWDCTWGWDAHRAGDALVINWWRRAFGARHERDLWVVVDAEFFADSD